MLRCVQLVTPRTGAHQASLSMGFPRQEYWGGLPFRSPGDLPGVKPDFPVALAFAGRFFPTEPPSVHFSSVAQSCPTLRPHALQHTRPPCLSPTPGVYPNSCPLSQWCHSAISSSVVPLSSCLQSFPTWGSFPMSQLFASGGQNIGSLSFNISPSSEHPGLISFKIDWFYLLAVQGTLKSLLQHHSSKASILWCSAVFIVQLSHSYMTTGKTIALTRQSFVGKVMSLLFNMLSRLVITFLPRSKRLLISWLQSPSAVILEPPKI